MLGVFVAFEIAHLELCAVRENPCPFRASVNRADEREDLPHEFLNLFKLVVGFAEENTVRVFAVKVLMR